VTKVRAGWQEVTVEVAERKVELGPLRDLVGYHLRRASAAFATDFSREFGGTAIRPVLVGILSVVSANPGINQGSVGESLGIKRANMVPLINELTQSELVSRRPSDEDRRALCLTLTAHGQRVLDDCLIRIGAHENEMLADLSADERSRLVTMLMKIARTELARAVAGPR
jgi:DNA-binding MarR family transcriptional regulator